MRAPMRARPPTEQPGECLQDSRGCAPPSARGLAHESWFSSIYRVPKGARPQARAASHRAARRVRLVAFREFRKARECKLKG